MRKFSFISLSVAAIAVFATSMAYAQQASQPAAGTAGSQMPARQGCCTQEECDAQAAHAQQGGGGGAASQPAGTTVRTTQ